MELDTFDQIMVNFSSINLNKKTYDLDDMEKMMDKYSKGKNYLDFILFIRRMVPYLENEGITFTESVRRLL